MHVLRSLTLVLHPFVPRMRTTYPKSLTKHLGANMANQFSGTGLSSSMFKFPIDPYEKNDVALHISKFCKKITEHGKHNPHTRLVDQLIDSNILKNCRIQYSRFRSITVQTWDVVPILTMGPAADMYFKCSSLEIQWSNLPIFWRIPTGNSLVFK